MNIFTLQIRVRQADGGLERILSVTRRRRFELTQLSVESSNDGAYFDVEMTVRGERAGQILLKQLEKLEDVSAVSLTMAPAELVDARVA